jgi:hypothetical protein
LPCAVKKCARKAPLCRAPENMRTAKIETYGNHRFSRSEYELLARNRWMVLGFVAPPALGLVLPFFKNHKFDMYTRYQTGKHYMMREIQIMLCSCLSHVKTFLVSTTWSKHHK